jgi:hypothetical protein
MDQSESRDRALSAALRALAEDDAAMGASPIVEARLLAEVRSIARARRRNVSVSFAAIAAALIIAVALPVSYLVTYSPLANPPAVRTAPSEVATAFLPLIYSNVPVTNAHIVRMKVSRRALVSFGLASIDSSESSSAATVLADVIVGEDGLARAVRFVRPIVRQE